MVASARAGGVANYFLERAKKELLPLTHLHLQKLVYIGYGWCLELLDRPIFVEPIEAWRYGPVVPVLYHEFKYFGARTIRRQSADYDYEAGDFCIHEIERGGELEDCLDWVWRGYRGFAARQLMDLTHRQGTPWYETMRTLGEGHRISDDLIHKHFHQKHLDLLRRERGEPRRA